MQNKTQGFTLIELLIVIAIIGILAAVLIPNLMNAKKAANTSAAQSYLRNAVTAAETARANNQTIAPSTDCWASPLSLASNPGSISECKISQNSNATVGYVKSTTGKYFTFDGQVLSGPSDTGGTLPSLP